jgi:hypothetical protein
VVPAKHNHQNSIGGGGPLCEKFTPNSFSPSLCHSSILLLYFILVSSVGYSYQLHRCGFVTMVEIDMVIHKDFVFLLIRSDMSNTSGCYCA